MWLSACETHDENLEKERHTARITLDETFAEPARPR
jgi:hypothetical protein